MNIKQAYNQWAEQYDSNENKTRDLDKKASAAVLSNQPFSKVLEIGCGTGKNTAFLLSKADRVLAVDFSDEMLAKARAKITDKRIRFVRADITESWPLPDNSVDLVCCNLVLEHIENLKFIFHQAYQKLMPGGLFFISELHPFKHYLGSKARFESSKGLYELETYIHHLSDYLSAAKSSNFILLQLDEWFDDSEETEPPRLITILFQK